MAGTTQTMRDHWWWRPGWRVGRSFYTWHVTFDDQPTVHQLAADYADLLRELPTLDPIPGRWLHLTMQGIGFADEVHRADLERIIDATRDRCATLSPFTIILVPAQVDPEALLLPVRPAEPMIALRAAIRAGIATVWGPENIPENPYDFHPHVSLAYSNSPGPAQPIAQRLATRMTTSAQITVERVTLINLNRDRHIYTWIDVATADLSAGR